MSRRRLTDAQEKVAISAYQSGRSCKDVASDYGCSAAAIRNVLVRHGVERRGCGDTRKLSAAQECEVAREYRQGSSIASVAQRWGVGARCIQRTLARQGVPIRRAGETGRALSHEDEACVARGYASGISSCGLAKKWGLSRTTIVDILRRQGVETRSRSVSQRRHTLDDSVFDEVTDDTAYWVGFLMADGCVWRNTISLGLSLVDIGHLHKFRDFLKSSHPIRTLPATSSHGVKHRKAQARIKVASSRIVQRLAEFGVVPRKSHTAEVQILEDNRHFWRGVIDGDGTISCRQESRTSRPAPRVSVVGSRRLVGQFARYAARSAGGCVADRKIQQKSPTVSVIGLQGRAAESLVDLLYGECGVALDRKKRVADEVLSKVAVWDSWFPVDGPGGGSKTMGFNVSPTAKESYRRVAMACGFRSVSSWIRHTLDAAVATTDQS